MERYWVYMLRCADGSFYVGVTNNLELRVGQHNFGWNPESYTHERRPVSLVYSQEFQNVLDAIDAEKQIKGWNRAKKQALIDGNWEKIRELSRMRGSNR